MRKYTIYLCLKLLFLIFILYKVYNPKKNILINKIKKIFDQKNVNFQNNVFNCLKN